MKKLNGEMQSSWRYFSVPDGMEKAVEKVGVAE
jgi:hypothetical protein